MVDGDLSFLGYLFKCGLNTCVSNPMPQDIRPHFVKESFEFGTDV